MNVRRLITVATLALWLATGTASGAGIGAMSKAAPTRIEVFTAADRPVRGLAALQARGIRVTRYRIDDITRINALLSLGLPADEDRAAAMAIERIQHNRSLIERRYARCAQGLMRAVQYRLDRYPAVVFDGRATVYGVTDLAAALERYRAWTRARRP